MQVVHRVVQQVAGEALDRELRAVGAPPWPLLYTPSSPKFKPCPPPRRMDIDALLQTHTPARAAVGLRNFAAGIAQPKTVRADMLHGFRHGKAVGSPTHWGEWDNHFKWKPGELTIVTGQNNAGKSETVLQWQLTKSIRDGWKWAVVSPENEPVSEIYDQLAHAMAGQSTDPTWANCMREQTYERCMDFLFEHFYIIESDKLAESPTPELIFEYFAYCVKTHGVQGCFIDPWNQLYHDMPTGEVQYLSNELNRAKRFARQYNQCLVISHHPVKPQTDNGKVWRCPTQFDLSSGAMWGNKADNVLAVHRPFYLENKSNTLVEWHAHKIKKQKLVGRPGFVTLDFDYARNRYTLDGTSPFEPWASHIVAPELAGPPPLHGMPASMFDAPPAAPAYETPPF